MVTNRSLINLLELIEHKKRCKPDEGKALSPIIQDKILEIMSHNQMDDLFKVMENRKK